MKSRPAKPVSKKHVRTQKHKKRIPAKGGRSKAKAVLRRKGGKVTRRKPSAIRRIRSKKRISGQSKRDIRKKSKRRKAPSRPLKFSPKSKLEKRLKRALRENKKLKKKIRIAKNRQVGQRRRRTREYAAKRARLAYEQGTLDRDYTEIAEETGLTPREVYTLGMSPQALGTAA